MRLKTYFNNGNIFFISMYDSIFEHKIFSIKEIYLMGWFKSRYLFIPLGFLSKE